VEHWLRILEQKFQLLTVTDEQKVRFTAQQLLGSASAWWDTFNAMQLVDHHVTWQEFTIAFREYYIPAGVLNRKLSEFLDLKQGNMTVIEYVNKFNHLAQYAGTHVTLMRRRGIVSTVAFHASYKRSCILGIIRLLVHCCYCYRGTLA
jgi:hypothetical protein